MPALTAQSGEEDLLRPPRRDQPGTLLIHLLNHCNLYCQHCYLEAGPQGDTMLPLDLVTGALDQVHSLGIASVRLSGGEPLLYPELATVLAAASRLNDIDVCLCSNGTLIGAPEARLLVEAGARAQISIDGPEGYHDWVRGSEGAFRRASEGIKHLIAAGVPLSVVLTLRQDNLDSLPWLADWAVEMGVGNVSVQPLVRVGRGSHVLEQKLLEEQMRDLFLRLSDLGHAYRSRGLGISLAYRTRRFLLAHPCAAYVCNGSRCHRKVRKEIKTLVIREDGTVLPEIPTLNGRYALGNLHDASLTGLVTRYFDDGYAQFDQLCRMAYEEVMPNWTAPLIAWDEIISERSWLSGA